MAIPTLTYPPTNGQTINTLPNGGQASGANSLPVVIASDQSPVPTINASGTNAIGSVGTTGTTGLDYSANKPAIPNIGSAFANSGPYANYVLVATVPASATRNKVDIENASGAQIVVVRDDGTAAGGASPANASMFPLSGGSGTGVQGSAWASTTFKGRLQIYAASSTAFVSVLVD